MEFDSAGFEDLASWVEQDRAQALRVIRLIRETQRDHSRASANRTALRHELAGCWSRRIDREHRLVYQVLPDKIESWMPLSLLTDHSAGRLRRAWTTAWQKTWTITGSLNRRIHRLQ